MCKINMHLLTFFLLLFSTFHVHAVSDAGSVKYLSQIYVQMKKELEEIKKAVDEAKATNDSLHNMKNTINDLNDEYQFIRDFDPDREVRQLKNWSEGITGLDDLSNAEGFQAKWRILNSEINKRINNRRELPSSLNDRSISLMQSMLDKMKENEALLRAYKKAALDQGDEQTVADLQKLSASSEALTASLMLEQKHAQLEKQKQRHVEVLNGIQKDAAFVKFLEGSN